MRFFCVSAQKNPGGAKIAGITESRDLVIPERRYRNHGILESRDLDQNTAALANQSCIDNKTLSCIIRS